MDRQTGGRISSNRIDFPVFKAQVAFFEDNQCIKIQCMVFGAASKMYTVGYAIHSQDIALILFLKIANIFSFSRQMYILVSKPNTPAIYFTSRHETTVAFAKLEKKLLVEVITFSIILDNIDYRTSEEGILVSQDTFKYSLRSCYCYLASPHSPSPQISQRFSIIRRPIPGPSQNIGTSAPVATPMHMQKVEGAN